MSRAASRLFEDALRLDERSDAFAGLAIAASALGLDTLAVERTGFAIRATCFTAIWFGYLQIIYIKALGEFTSCDGSIVTRLSGY
jgi:hypothetical protein